MLNCSPCSPAVGKFVKGYYILDSDNLNFCPQVLPRSIKNVELIRCDGGTELTSNSPLESIIENLEKVSSETKFEDIPDGGYKATTVTTYSTKPDAETNKPKVGKSCPCFILRQLY